MHITGEWFRRQSATTSTRLVLSLVLSLVVTASTLAACEPAALPGDAAGRTGSALRGTVEPTAASASQTTTAREEKVLDGGTVRARRSGLSFAVPEGWQAMDPAMMVSAGADAVPEYFEQLARSSGVSVDELAAQLGRAAEVIVMGPPSKGFAPNITVVPSPAMFLPGPAQLRAELTSVGATNISVRDRGTPLGPARVVSASLKVGSLTVASRPIVVEHDGHVSTITVATTDAHASDALVDDVIASLAGL